MVPRSTVSITPLDWTLSSPLNYSILQFANWSSAKGNMTLSGNVSQFMLVDLNSLVHPLYQGQDVRKHINLIAQFYITVLPQRGKLYQAFRNKRCLNDTNFAYPQSCVWCCGNDFSAMKYSIPGITDETILAQESIVPNPHCCARTSASGNRIFSVGEQITAIPSKVKIIESGFLWFEPDYGTVGSPYAWFQFQVEYWKAAVPPLSAPTDSDSGCQIDRNLCATSKNWCTINSDLLSEMCCGRCTNISIKFQIVIEIISTEIYPQVGFGGHMISFDGEDTSFN